jgi:hypothetical protein
VTELEFKIRKIFGRWHFVDERTPSENKIATALQAICSRNSIVHAFREHGKFWICSRF